MIAVDTNVIVRLLTRDEPEQYVLSKALFEQEDIFIPDTVILESGWALRYSYHFEREQVIGAFRALFGLPNVRLRNPAVVAQALAWHEDGLDFADALHLAQSQHCERMVTFDRRLVRRSEGRSVPPATLLR